MTDDIPPSSQVRPEDEAQGQKMTIYMPQGAVIIERSELEPTVEPTAQITPEEAPVLPKTGNETVQSVGAVINIYTGDESRGVKEQDPSKALATDSALMDEQHVLLRISEMLDVITKRIDHDAQPIVQSAQPIVQSAQPIVQSAQPIVQSAQPTGTVILSTNSVEEIEKNSAIVRGDQNVENNFALKGHHFDWMHAFNLMYISVILFSMLLPAGLHSILKTEVLPALTSYEAAGIHKGDLLVAVEAQASSLVVGDVLAVHDPILGTEEVAQVSEILAPVNGIVTFAIPPRAGQTLGLSYSLGADSEIYKVIKFIPTLGTAKLLLDSFYLQFFVGVAVILLNVIVHFRRHRRYSKSLRTDINQ